MTAFVRHPVHPNPLSTLELRGREALSKLEGTFTARGTCRHALVDLSLTVRRGFEAGRRCGRPGPQRHITLALALGLLAIAFSEGTWIPLRRP